MYDTAIRAPDLSELFGVASEQAGYFTAAQAHACGYSKQLPSHHAASGRFIRLRRGLYRLHDYPSSRYEEVMAARLAAVRHHLRAQLTGRIFEETTVDIGLADPLGWSPDPIICPDLPSFAGITPIYVPVLSLAQYVAEKLHAYTRGYSGGAILGTRVKDLVDLVLIVELETFDAVHLREALIGVFAGRGRHSLPAAVPLPPDTWPAPYRILAEPVGIDPDVLHGPAHAAAFLDPVLAVPFEGRWDHLAQQWVAPGAGA